MTIAPAPSTLGLESPALGPWFEPDVTLAAPAADLSVPVQATANLAAYPPAIGTLGYHVAADPAPAELRRLRDATGAPAFATGNLVALFTLLPEVEQRLFTLAQSIPQTVTGNAPAGTPTRLTVRHLAYEFGAATMTLLEALAAPPIDETAPDGSSRADLAAHLGLVLADDDETLLNGDHPMTDLHVPGELFGADRVPMIDVANQAFALWAFDDGGRAIDPGAVASWWNHMAKTIFNNLWAPGDPADGVDRTASFAAQLTVHLVNPAEGPLDADLMARVTSGGTAVTSALVQASATTGAALAFTAAPGAGGGADDAPVPLMAMLPNGTYAAGSPVTQSVLTVYPRGPVHADVTRDYIRVAVVDVERHLVGQARVAPDGSDDGSDVARRAADQNRTTTQVAVNRVANLVLHTTIDTAVTQMLAGFGTNPTTLVMPTLDREFAPLTTPTLTPVTPPTAPPTIIARPLVGGGEPGGQGERIDGQVVLLQLQFDGWPNTQNAGPAWVRVWPKGFDLDRGRHVPLDGGAGVTTAAADGSSATADVVVTLPNGVLDDRNDIADLACDIAVVTTNTATPFAVFADVRFARPEPLAGGAIDVDAADALVASEAGPQSPVAALRPGSALFSFEDDGTVALVDRTSVDPGGFAGSIDAAITTDDVVVLTEPAWVQSDPGDVLASDDLALAPGAVQRATRLGFTRLAAGGPLPTMEFLDAVSSSAAPATATIGPAAGLRREHELPPHMLGHPGAPAAREVGGTGLTVGGRTAVVVAEHTRDRAFPGLPALLGAASAAMTVPLAATAPNPWVAVLGTVGFGVDGEPTLSELIRLAEHEFPGFDNAENVISWLENVVNILPSTFDVTGDIPRALMRRLLSSAWGLREAATSLAASFTRAEDLVYIETQAIDTLRIGAEGDTINPVQSLVSRLEQRPALHVVLCLPRRSPAGWPAKLGRVRDTLAQQTIAALETAGPGRVGVFHPSAGRDRALDLASTAVVVDDVYALVGTSHLWRRGLSFDRSIAAAVFDEALTLGRPRAVRTLRLALLAQRLGTTVPSIPLDPFELVSAVRELSGPGAGFGRTTTQPITTPDPVPSELDIDLWNRDGSAIDGFDPFTWLTGDAQSQFVNDVP